MRNGKIIFFNLNFFRNVCKASYVLDNYARYVDIANQLRLCFSTKYTEDSRQICFKKSNGIGYKIYY